VAQVSKLLALQGAQLWNHGDLQPEVIPEDGDMWSKVQHEPPVPALDLDQLRMLKAEFRALVPAFPTLSVQKLGFFAILTLKPVHSQEC